MATHYIYVDNREALVKNGPCDFTIVLPEDLNLQNASYRIDQFRMVNALPNIDANNCNLYVLRGGSVSVVMLATGY